MKKKSKLLVLVVLAIMLTLAVCSCNRKSTFTVTFNTDGGSTVSSQSIEKGGRVTRPTVDPIKDNYVFVDWYKDSEKTILFDFENKIINSKTTIYAKWLEPDFQSFTYELINDDTAYEIVDGYTDSGIFIIPDTYNSLPVTSIGVYAFNGTKDLNYVRIGNNVEIIWGSAFEYCRSLKNVIISDSVTTIGSQAFYNCDMLQSITIPSSVTSIESQAFEFECKGLKVVLKSVVPPSQQQSFYSAKVIIVPAESLETYKSDWSHYSSIIYKDTDVRDGKYIVDEDILAAYFGDDKEFVVPKTIKTIGERAFSYCYDLDSVTIPNSVTEINEYAFASSNISNIKLGKNIKIIDDGAFFECENLRIITLGKSIESIGYRAFYDCKRLAVIMKSTVPPIVDDSFSGIKGIIVPSSSLAEYKTKWSRFAHEMYSDSNLVEDKYVVIDNVLLFYFGADKELNIPKKITRIEENAFIHSKNLEKITIPSSVVSIGKNAFDYCDALTKVNITDMSAWCAIEFENMYSNPLSYAKNLYLKDKLIEKLVIPNGVTSIGNYSFYNCSSLSKVTIPSGVVDIGISAFTYCTSLTVIMENAVPPTEQYAFYDVIAIIVPAASLSGYTADTSSWSNYSSKIYGDSNVVIQDNYIISDNVFVSYFGKDATFVVPNNITSIGKYAFSDCTTLQSITIPSSIKSVETKAFYGCSGLTKVNITDMAAWCDIAFSDAYSNPVFYSKNLYLNDTLVKDLVIPNNVTSINFYAFINCSLTSVTIPSSVTNINGAAFYDCNDLTKVYITDMSAWCDIKFYNEISNPLYYAKNLYLNNALVKDLVIPDNVTSIKSYAFSGCSSLTNVTIPSSVTSFGEKTFYDCKSLISISLPFLGEKLVDPSKAYLGYLFGASENYSFESIPESLRTVIIRGGTRIGSSAFSNLRNLTSVSMPSSITSIGNSAFDRCSGLTDITIPSSVTSIGSKAFNQCSGLTDITIPSSVTSIDSGAFDSCSNLTKVNITDLSAWYAIEFGDHQSNPLFYAKNLYLNNTLIENLVIPNDLTSINMFTFFNCSSLIKVTIPSSVVNIGYQAFLGCDRLTVIMENAVPPTELYSFFDVRAIIVPAASLAAYTDETSSWLNYSPRIYGDSNVVSNDKYIASGNILVSYFGKDVSYVVPNTITSIGDYAFSGCSDLASITIPSSVTRIGDSAFRSCSGLASITIPSSVTRIGREAFYYCDGLTKVNITDIAAWCDIVFDSLSANPLYYAKNLYLNDVLVKDLVIPNNVTSIKFYAFSGCSSLTNVTIPNSVTSIGREAFFACTSLTSITISSGVNSIDSYAFERCSKLTSVVFENADGWFVASSSDATSGTDLTLSDPQVNAEYFTKTYCNYYWFRK